MIKLYAIKEYLNYSNFKQGIFIRLFINPYQSSNFYLNFANSDPFTLKFSWFLMFQLSAWHLSNVQLKLISIRNLIRLAKDKRTFSEKLQHASNVKSEYSGGEGDLKWVNKELEKKKGILIFVFEISAVMCHLSRVNLISTHLLWINLIWP